MTKVLQQRNLGSLCWIVQGITTYLGKRPFFGGSLILGKLWEGSSHYKAMSCWHPICLALLAHVNSLKTHCFFGSFLQLVPLIFKPLGLLHQFFSLRQCPSILADGPCPGLCNSISLVQAGDVIRQGLCCMVTWASTFHEGSSQCPGP